MSKLTSMKLKKWQSKPMERPPNNEEANYLAGLADGEGSFFIVKQPRRSKGEETFHYFPEFAVVMNSPLVKELWQLFGGELYQRRVRRKKYKFIENYLYYWIVRRSELLKCITLKMMPFLREKRPQAELILKALETTDKKELERLKTEISKLNQKRYGPDPMFYPEKRKD